MIAAIMQRFLFLQFSQPDCKPEGNHKSRFNSGIKAFNGVKCE